MTLVLTALVTGCSVEKNTGASRFYNSLVAKYNVWFNGNEAYKAGVEKVQSSHRDDYSALLPVFEYTSPESLRAAASDMERAMQKASKVIALYSITAKPEKKSRNGDRTKDDEFYNRREYNEWVDDAYILLAKSQFYLSDLTGARSSFSYAISIATDPELVTEGTIWLARIQTEDGNYSEASRILQEIDDVKGLSKALKPMYYTTLADIALRQKRYSEAVTPLTMALESNISRQTRVRLTYLLAQVSKETGDNNLSTRYFREVINMNPPYEYEFNAGINLAGVADLSHGDAEDLMKSLRKMLRDSKNKDYLDQIYFALGELQKRLGHTDEALKYWQQSAGSSTNNYKQKARAYLALGEYYFTKPEYMTAYMYYDSASSLIDERFPDYALISKRTVDLGEYADFHSVVVTEDSLRRVAQMSESERNALISGIINDYEAGQAKEKQDSGNDRYNMGLYYENEQRAQGSISAEGGWYFYNQAALAFGRTEFRRRWGDRKLEDNWRRSNKARIAFTAATAPENGVEQIASDSTGKAPERTKEYYLRNLPMTDSLMNLSLLKSANALLGEGKILASRLSDTIRAAEVLEEAAKKGNDDMIRAEALYELYRLLRNSDPAKAERRRSELLTEFPQSEYALILSDPDYVRRQQEMAAKAQKSYDAAYDAFTQERYEETHALCAEAFVQFPDDDLVPKFMLLDAMATGATRGEMAYKEKLDSLTAKYPDTPEGKRAAEIIAFLRKEIPAIQVAEDTHIAVELYKQDTVQPYYVMIIAGNIKANLNQMVFDVINFNLDNFKDKNYRTEGKAVDPDYLLITVGIFNNAEEASAWLSAFDPSVNIREAASADLSLFIISRDNLEKFNNDKNINRYRIFYETAYQNIR
jgi:tetratricopeptide (TPR) repeat protein